MSRQADPPFKILWRVFVEQFAANESATSDMQMRRAIIGVIAFLVTPGLFLMFKTMSGYELMVMIARHRNTPQIIETFLAQMAVLFVSYSMISTGLLTVFIWDTLVFDKRDAMVLGPLPLRGLTIVGAKLAALATFLVGTALAVNVVSGVSFGWVTGALEGRILQHLSAHLSGTIGGAVFMFCTLVVVRGLLVLFVSAHAAATAGSLLQFVFLSAVLCFMMVPTATGLVLPPMSWFAALFEWIRGSRAPAVPGLAQYALIVLPISIAGAIAVTFAGYWKQMRAALAPSASVAGTARIRRRLASAHHRTRSRGARHIRLRLDDARAQPRAAGADRHRGVARCRDRQHRARDEGRRIRRAANAEDGRPLDSDRPRLLGHRRLARIVRACRPS